MNLRIWLVAILILGFSFTGWEAQRISYYDHSPYWGIPVRVEEAQAEAPVNSTIEIARLRQQVQDQAQQQKWLYNQLFNAQVNLEEKSHLEFELINRIGPMANLDLRDLTKTQDALVLAATYEANLTADSPLRSIVSELRMMLMQTGKLKLEFLEKLNKHRIDHPIIITYTEPIYIPPQIDDPQSEYTIIPARPVWYRTWNISEEDGWLLFIGHRIMADIDTVQTKMAKNVSRIVRLYEMSEPQETQAVGTFMFFQERSKNYIQVGAPLFRCKIGLFWCSRVGIVIDTYTQPYKASHPSSGALLHGYLVEVELSDQRALTSKVLHVDRPTSH